MHPDRGILYIATGPKYVRQAIVSAEKASEVTELPIAIVSDQDVDHPIFDYIIKDHNPKHSYIDKARNISKSPFDKTLFLDTDAYVLSDIMELFELLDEFELAAAVDPNEVVLRYSGERHFDNVPESVPEYNTGVIVYRNNERVNNLMQNWVSYCTTANPNDQIGFRKALYESDVRITALSPVYNTLINWPVQVTGEVKIIHGVGGSISDSSEVEKVADRVNKKTGVRILYSLRHGHVVYPTSKYGTIITRKYSSIMRYTFDRIYTPFVHRPIYLLNKRVQNVCDNGILNTIKKELM
ncbi:putative nucleotide-diphospho-sugar transferase [Salinibaculum salinum]|uniref:putative nucleotide-diphospho-sugar transferase n=1 Tax=Salinibaculum salinum TaxID=3131996 RepID=UPI0030EB54F1